MYLLLILTLLIWSFIIYKIFFTNEDENDGNLATETIRVNEKVEDKFDPIPLLLNYRDPFLKTATVVKNKRKLTPSKKRVVRNQVSWPKIKYSGLIQNKVTNERRINITINNKNYIMKENDKVRDILLVKIHADSIILSKNKVTKSFINPK